MPAKARLRFGGCKLRPHGPWCAVSWRDRQGLVRANAIAEIYGVLPKYRCPSLDCDRFQDKAASAIEQHTHAVEGQRSKPDLVVVRRENPHICQLPLRLDGRIFGPSPAAGALPVETDVHRAVTRQQRLHLIQASANDGYGSRQRALIRKKCRLKIASQGRGLSDLVSFFERVEFFRLLGFPHVRKPAEAGATWAVLLVGADLRTAGWTTELRDHLMTTEINIAGCTVCDPP